MLGGIDYLICIVRLVNQNWLTSTKVMPILFKCERHKNRSYYKWNKQIVILSDYNKK